VQRLTSRPVPFARLRNLTVTLGIDLLGNARGFGMFGLDVGLRAHENLVPNEFQSTDWPALRLGQERHRGHHGGPRIHGWVHSMPLPPATEGGDVYYLTVSFPRLLSRIVLADVAGHGQAIGATAATLRNLLRKHMNTLDQSVLPRDE
jgi:hypothetical protein